MTLIAWGWIAATIIGLIVSSILERRARRASYRQLVEMLDRHIHDVMEEHVKQYHPSTDT